ncbi:putative U3 small nucleolar RNA-associated protein 7 [Coemansia thaxteri]|uniref:U three protein 7 n=1 Tax=Coemansia thaxteri TaxID=2663907 RepID=A0A9W8BG58_9FUNG|nr:putative U3 small nucleolar RNA-associated protein 7 [Coemansia thaxteri]
MAATDKLSARLHQTVEGGSFARGAVSQSARNAENNDDSDGHATRSDDDGPAPRTLRDAPAKSDRAHMSKKSSKRDKGQPRKHSGNDSRTKEVQEKKEPDDIEREIMSKSEKYQRGIKPSGDNGAAAIAVKVRSKQARPKIEHEKRRREAAILEAARSEMLLTEQAGYLEAEGEMERTFKVTQDQLADSLDINTRAKIFDLKLNEFGPYAMDYTTNGRHLLIGGRKGHLATMDWRSGKLGAEFHVRETIRDVCWLHNESLFAVAQKKYAYIYDHSGAEVHCLQKHVEPTALGFLPFHFLLASTGMTGRLMYQDVTEGRIIGEHKPGYGPNHVLRVNPYNAVVHMGHGNGVVTMWSPRQSQPLAKILCHKGPVQAMAIDRSGTYMATSGLDGSLKVWDIRNFKALHEYSTLRPAQSLDISQRGLLAAGWGAHVTVWKDALVAKVEAPYMKRMLPATTVSDVRFVPYDDVLGYGHSSGISSIVIPGAGEPNFDAYVANPFQTTKQRQEAEVKQLLDKLAPETIQLDPTFIGRLDPRSREQRQREQLESMRDKYSQDKAEGKYLDNEVKNKLKGRNSSAKRFARKRQANIMDLKKLNELERIEQQQRESEAKRRKIPESEKGALGRFYDEKRSTAA